MIFILWSGSIQNHGSIQASKSAALRPSRRSGEEQNGERRARGSWRRAHQRWGRREAAGIRPAAGGWPAATHTGGQVRQRRVRHGRQHGRRVLGTWCQEVGRQAVEVVSHEDEQRQQGRFRKKLVVVDQYSTENGPVRLAELRFTKQDAKRQNEKETTRRTRWCAHLWSRMKDGDGRARRSWRGVAVVGEDDGVDVGFVWPTPSRCRARQGELQGGVRLHRKWTVSPEKLAGSSPEFSRCKSSVRVCGS
jgi:hypothetical protein